MRVRLSVVRAQLGTNCIKQDKENKENENATRATIYESVSFSFHADAQDNACGFGGVFNCSMR